MTFDKDKYARDYNRAANANPMTASCPPQWEADGVRDSAIEEVGNDILAEYIGNKDYMEEIFIEISYGQCDHTEMASAACKMMDNPKSLEAKIAFASAAETFIQKRITGLAEDKVDA